MAEPFIISAWEKPSDGWLRVTVRDTTLGMTDAFYWCEFDDAGNHYTSNRTWAWRQWSMAGKPSVKVDEERSSILSDLVLAHGVLRHLAPSFGIRSAPGDAGTRQSGA